MNKQIQSLFDAIYEACPELKIRVDVLEDLCQVIDFNEDDLDALSLISINISHILRTAAARNRYLEINCWGHINTSNPQHLDEYGEFDPECITKYICTIDLSKSVSDQEEEVLIKLSEIIL